VRKHRIPTAAAPEQDQEKEAHYVCTIPAKGFDAPQGHVLHIVFVKGKAAGQVMWLAAHAPAESTFKQVMSEGLPVFRSRSDILNVERGHAWDFWDEEKSAWHKLGGFDTNILRSTADAA